MGTLFSCERCPVAVQHSVITFSDALVLKLTEGKEPPPLTQDEINRENEEFRNMELLKCIDDNHSDAYGLTICKFNRLCEKLMRELNRVNSTRAVTEFKQLVKCYQKNPHCSFICEGKAKKFASYVGGELLYKFVTQPREKEYERYLNIDTDENEMMNMK